MRVEGLVLVHKEQHTLPWLMLCGWPMHFAACISSGYWFAPISRLYSGWHLELHAAARRWLR